MSIKNDKQIKKAVRIIKSLDPEDMEFIIKCAEYHLKKAHRFDYELEEMHTRNCYGEKTRPYMRQKRFNTSEPTGSCSCHIDKPLRSKIPQRDEDNYDDTVSMSGKVYVFKLDQEILEYRIRDPRCKKERCDCMVSLLYH
jgi:hypothetical protein